MPLEQIDEFLGLFNTNATLPETLLMDESSVKITATSLTDMADSVDLQLTIESNSGKALPIGDAYGSLSVNDIMTDYSYYTARSWETDSPQLLRSNYGSFHRRITRFPRFLIYRKSSSDLESKRAIRPLMSRRSHSCWRNPIEKDLL